MKYSIETNTLKNLETSVEDLQHLVKLATVGAAAILAPRYKTAWICSGNSILEVLARNLTLLNNGKHPTVQMQKDFKRDWCTLKAISGEPQESYRTLWYELDSEGYQVLSRPPNVWKPIETLLRDPRNVPNASGYLIGVYLKGKSQKMLVGVFEDVWAARAWVAMVYPDDVPIHEPVILEDQLTQEVLNIMSKPPSYGGV